jgi:hypothetical protein
MHLCHDDFCFEGCKECSETVSICEGGDACWTRSGYGPLCQPCYYLNDETTAIRYDRTYFCLCYY